MPRTHFNKRDFELLFETHFEDLMAFVYGYVRNQEVSRDIVHDAFMALWRRREVLDKRLSPKAYLYKLSRNMSLNYIRHQRVILTNEQSIITHEKDIRQEMDDYDRSYEILAKFVNKLPDKQREVIKMCFVEGKMYKEIAADLGISVNTVKTHLKRAMQFLRSELQ
ncbi:MAG: RNA polymerase sigma-70 factor [Bacteroidales bacterium]|nr:RNA polymerase sigma-70 factor [Bacteroidales bacterium]